MPAMFNTAGKVVLPIRTLVYYKAEKPPLSFIKATVPLPRGLKMIAGYDMISNAQGTGVTWMCVNMQGSSITGGKTIINCPSGMDVRAKVAFPDCWDGVNIDTSNHRSHMTYSIFSGSPTASHCPASHPIHIPEITVQVDYPNDGNSQNWRLSSDMSGQLNGASLHADWWGGWDEDIMKKWLNNCLYGLKTSNLGQLCDKTRLLNRDMFNGPYVVEPPAR